MQQVKNRLTRDTVRPIRWCYQEKKCLVRKRKITNKTNVQQQLCHLQTKKIRLSGEMHISLLCLPDRLSGVLIFADCGLQGAMEPGWARSSLLSLHLLFFFFFFLSWSWKSATASAELSFQFLQFHLKDKAVVFAMSFLLATSLEKAWQLAMC